MNWDKVRRDELVQARGASPVERTRTKPVKPRGITNGQAKELARLQRQLGEPYTGHGLTGKQAASAIAAARARFERRAPG
jgi:hypothetical protein